MSGINEGVSGDEVYSNHSSDESGENDNFTSSNHPSELHSTDTYGTPAYLLSPGAVNAYNDLTQGAEKYNTSQSLKDFSSLYAESKNNAKAGILEQDERALKVTSLYNLWQFKNFEGDYYILRGYMDNAKAHNIPIQDATKTYQSLSQIYFVKRIHKAYSTISPDNYVFSYTLIGGMNSYVKTEKLALSCEKSSDSPSCYEKASKTLKSSKDVFEKLNGICLSENDNDMKDCTIKTMYSEWFDTAMSYQNYNVGKYLFDISNKK